MTESQLAAQRNARCMDELAKMSSIYGQRYGEYMDEMDRLFRANAELTKEVAIMEQLTGKYKDNWENAERVGAILTTRNRRLEAEVLQWEKDYNAISR